MSPIKKSGQMCGARASYKWEWGFSDQGLFIGDVSKELSFVEEFITSRYDASWYWMGTLHSRLASITELLGNSFSSSHRRYAKWRRRRSRKMESIIIFSGQVQAHRIDFHELDLAQYGCSLASKAWMRSDAEGKVNPGTRDWAVKSFALSPSWQVSLTGQNDGILTSRAWVESDTWRKANSDATDWVVKIIVLLAGWQVSLNVRNGMRTRSIPESGESRHKPLFSVIFALSIGWQGSLTVQNEGMWVGRDRMRSNTSKKGRRSTRGIALWFFLLFASWQVSLMAQDNVRAKSISGWDQFWCKRRGFEVELSTNRQVSLA